MTARAAATCSGLKSRGRLSVAVTRIRATRSARSRCHRRYHRRENRITITPTMQKQKMGNMTHPSLLLVAGPDWKFICPGDIRSSAVPVRSAHSLSCLFPAVAMGPFGGAGIRSSIRSIGAIRVECPGHAMERPGCRFRITPGPVVYHGRDGIRQRWFRAKRWHFI